jgi:hypothetical protein
MKFSSYPVVTAVQPADTFLIHQDSSNAEKQVTADTVANSLNGMIDQDTVATLKAVDVTGLSTGTARTLGGYYALGDGGGGPVYYDSASTAIPNNGTVFQPNAGSGRWLRPASSSMNVRWFGALGNDSHNDTLAIQAAADAVRALGNGSVVVPAGIYKITAAITLANAPANNFSFVGEGQNVSIIKQYTAAANGLVLNFLNVGIDQPYRLQISDVGFQCAVQAGTGIVISYGIPVAVSSHYAATALISNVSVKSIGSANSWANGLDITSAWNCELTNVFVSGNDQGGTWANLSGSGFIFRRYCVNSTMTGCQASFFLNGLYVTAGGATATDGNTEGLFCSGCSFVATRKGVLIEGNVNATVPRMDGFEWTGGLLDLRGTQVGFDLQYVQDVRINGTFIVAGETGVGGIGCKLQNCGDVIISNTDFFAIDSGVVTSGTCFAINVVHNLFRGITAQVAFGGVITNSVSHGNQVYGANNYETNSGGITNRIYEGKGLTARAMLVNAQTFANATEGPVIWEVANVNDIATGNFLWDPASPTKLLVPAGVSRIRVTAGTRWIDNDVGWRLLKITDNNSAIWGAACVTGGAKAGGNGGSGDITCSTGVIEVATTGVTFLELKIAQSSGGNLNLRNVHGTYFSIEILG